MKKKIEVQDHWRNELTKLRCWLSGFSEGRQIPGQLQYMVPGELVLKQIISAIDDSKNKSSK